MMRIFLSISAACLLLICCRKPGGQEVMIAELRILDSFNRVELSHHINLIITQDTTNKALVSATFKDLSAIRTTVENGTLKIENANNSMMNRPGEKIDIHLLAVSPETIVYKGSGNITATNTIKANTFTIVSTTGAGVIHLDVEAEHTVAGIYEESADIILSGNTNSTYVYCSSRGTMDLRALRAATMNIYYSSVRNAYVWVTDQITGTIYHKGNVYYKGTPQVQSEIKSEGNFIPL